MIIFTILVYIWMTALTLRLGVDERADQPRLGAWIILTCWLPLFWVVVGLFILLYYAAAWLLTEGKNEFKNAFKGVLKDAFRRNK